MQNPVGMVISGWLIPAPNPKNDLPVVWRGMMVMKAVQQVSNSAPLVWSCHCQSFKLIPAPLRCGLDV